MSLRPAALGALTAAAVACPLPAVAQGPVDRAIHLYERGEFERAEAAFREAEEGDELTRADLARLLATRALLHFAAEHAEAMERDLLALALIQPDYALGERAPPAVRRAFRRARGHASARLALDLAAARRGDAIEVRATVAHDLIDLVRRVELAARAPGEEWVRSATGRVQLPGGAEVVEAHAEAIGPGGAVLLSEGTEEAPQVLRLDAAPGGGATPGGGLDVGLVVGLSAGGAALVAAIAITAALLAGSSSTLQAPVVDWGGG